MESVDLDWKLKTFFLVFAPCTQLSFLGAYIYFWMSEKSEKKEVRIVVGIVNMLSEFLFNCLLNKQIKILNK